MLTIIGQVMNIAGFVILFFNGGFIRNFNRLESISLGDQGFEAKNKKGGLPLALNTIGFLLVIVGSCLQLAETLGSGWSDL